MSRDELEPAIPQDYDKDDGYDDEQGFEKCPHCGQKLGTETGHLGTVYDQRGREYEHFHNTDPGQGPFFCPDCWPELERNEKQSENTALEEFV